MKQTIHAAVFDDHILFGKSVAIMLEHNGFVDFAHSFSDVTLFQNFLSNFSSNKIYVFIDYFIPNVNVLLLIGDIKRNYPTIKIIVVSSVVNSVLIQQILDLKPNGFISKVSDFNEISQCFKNINNNIQYISPYIKDALKSNDQPSIINLLTPPRNRNTS